MNLTQLIDAYKNFQTVTKNFQSITTSSDFLNDPVKVKDVNTKLKKLLKLFVKPEGVPGRPFYRNALVAPNRDDGTYPSRPERTNL